MPPPSATTTRTASSGRTASSATASAPAPETTVSAASNVSPLKVSGGGLDAVDAAFFMTPVPVTTSASTAASETLAPTSAPAPTPALAATPAPMATLAPPAPTPADAPAAVVHTENVDDHAHAAATALSGSSRKAPRGKASARRGGLKKRLARSSDVSGSGIALVSATSSSAQVPSVTIEITEASDERRDSTMPVVSGAAQAGLQASRPPVSSGTGGTRYVTTIESETSRAVSVRVRTGHDAEQVCVCACCARARGRTPAVPAPSSACVTKTHLWKKWGREHVHAPLGANVAPHALACLWHDRHHLRVRLLPATLTASHAQQRGLRRPRSNAHVRCHERGRWRACGVGSVILARAHCTRSRPSF